VELHTAYHGGAAGCAGVGAAPRRSAGDHACGSGAAEERRHREPRPSC